MCVLGVQIEGDESDDDGNLVFFSVDHYGKVMKNNCH